MVKDAMYRTAAVEIFHRGAVLVRKEKPLSYASTMSRDLMSSELMGMKDITASIG
jgi:hypothetical protein